MTLDNRIIGILQDGGEMTLAEIAKEVAGRADNADVINTLKILGDRNIADCRRDENKRIVYFLTDGGETYAAALAEGRTPVDPPRKYSKAATPAVIPGPIVGKTFTPDGNAQRKSVPKKPAEFGRRASGITEDPVPSGEALTALLRSTPTPTMEHKNVRQRVELLPDVVVDVQQTEQQAAAFLDSMDGPEDDAIALLDAMRERPPQPFREQVPARPRIIVRKSCGRIVVASMFDDHERPPGEPGRDVEIWFDISEIPALCSLLFDLAVPK